MHHIWRQQHNIVFDLASVSTCITPSLDNITLMTSSLVLWIEALKHRITLQHWISSDLNLVEESSLDKHEGILAREPSIHYIQSRQHVTDFGLTWTSPVGVLMQCVQPRPHHIIYGLWSGLDFSTWHAWHRQNTYCSVKHLPPVELPRSRTQDPAL
jgi:hypothetical protein